MTKGVRASRKAVRASTISVLAMAVVGCGLKQPPPFTPRLDQRTQNVAASTYPPPELPPLPTTLPVLVPENPPSTGPTAVPPATGVLTTTSPASISTSTHQSYDNTPKLRMSLQEIIHRAVANSKEVRVSGYDAAVAKTRILEAQAHFDPVAYSRLTYSDQKILTPSNSIIVTNPFNPQIFRVFDVQTGLQQNLPSGGQVDLRYEMQRIQQTPAGSVNPYYVEDVMLQITQPLLQTFGYEINQARITIARNDYRVSLLDFRKTLEENLMQLETDYWQLAELEQELNIDERLLGLSRDTLRILVERAHQGGDVSRVQLSQAQSRIETRVAVLVDVKSRIQDASDDIKRRMNDPEFPGGGPVTLLAADASEDQTEIHFDPDDTIRTALTNRFELGQQSLRIESAGIAAEVARNNLLPKLNLTGTLSVQGPGKDIGRAFDQIGRSQYIGGSIGLELNWPLGNREGRAIYRRAMLQRIQAMTQYQLLIAQVTEDVTKALRAVETSWQQIGTRRTARFAAADYLLALQQRQEQGEPLRPEFVQLLLDAQEQLAEAERQEMLAVANYNLSVAAVERAKGTLLRYNNVLMAEERFTSMEK